MKIRLGTSEFNSLVTNRSVPECNNTKKVDMGGSDMNYMFKPGTTGQSVWTDSVGPCHAVLVYGTPKESGLGMLGIVHVTGDHGVVMDEADDLLEKMEKNALGPCDWEVFIVGGDTKGEQLGHFVDEGRLSQKLTKSATVTLIVSPISKEGDYVKIELTSERKINIEPHK